MKKGDFIILKRKPLTEKELNYCKEHGINETEFYDRFAAMTKTIAERNLRKAASVGLYPSE